MFNRACIYLIVFLGLTACGGGGESQPSSEVSKSAPVQVVPEPITAPAPIVNTVDFTGKAGTKLLVAKKINGEPTESLANVSSSFSNAIGTIRHASSSANVEGNLTLGVTASDSDLMQSVSLYLPNSGRSFVICSNDCSPDYESTITGFNPELADETAGSLRIELIVEDSLGNSAVVDALSVNWQPIQISALNASRENNVVSVSWSGNSKLARYNLYAATESGVTALNALELENGIQQLAINTTSAQFSDVDLSKNYSLLITGIDSGGESGASAPYILPKVGGIPNTPPIANNDNYEINEDESLTANILDNDQDPEGQLIQLDSILQQPFNGVLDFDDIGNITYQPSPNFNGIDSFSYRIIDTEGAISEAMVVFNILPVNDSPVAVDDVYGVDVRGSISLDEGNLLSNDSDIDSDTLSVLTTPIEGPQKGTLVLNADGSFSYQSFEVLVDNDQFVYQIRDDQGATANATVQILANGDISPPIALNDVYQVDEDETLVIASIDLGILSNDSDPNSLPFELLEDLITDPEHGQLNLALNGTFTYIPNSNFFGVDQFQYQIKNSAGMLAQAFVTITVEPAGDIPIALDDNYQAEEDMNLIVSAISGLLINDIDFDDSILIVNTTPISPPQKGQLVLANNGGFSYMPSADFSGIDSFTYQVINAAGLTNTANVNITVMPRNDAPIAADDTATTNEDTSIVVDVIANDIDVDGDAIFLLSVDNAIASIENNTLRITPPENFFGQLSVSYEISDGVNETATASLFVTVLPVNDIPSALDDNYSTFEDTLLDVLITGAGHLLDNDSDVDGDTLTINTTPVSNVNNGSLNLSSNGSFRYIPNSNFSGSDSFIYQVSDGNGGSAQATVNLTINGVNDTPVLTADSYSVDEDNELRLLVGDINQLLSNDSDADGDTLTVNTTPITTTSNGSLTLNSDGSFSYNPQLDFNGTDSFIYEVSDGHGASAQASVSLTVNPVNDIPLLTNDSYAIDEDLTLTKLVGDIDQLLSNDSDADGDTLTINTTPVSNVNNGSLNLSSNGSFRYIPNSNFSGSDSFIYQVSDGNGGSAQATVNLTINAVNDTPVLTADSYSVDEDNELRLLVGDINQLLSNDSDADGDTLTVNTTPITTTSNGSLTLNSDGSFSYNPQLDFNGTDSFIYEVSDGHGASAQASVSLTVNPVNDIPLLTNDSYGIDEDLTLTKLLGDIDQLLSNDSDADGDTLTVNTVPVVGTNHGALTLNNDGSFIYIPTDNYNGSDSFIYQVNDGQGGTAQASATLTINAINDIPVAGDNSYNFIQNTTLNVLPGNVNHLLANDNDIDGDALTVDTTPVNNVINGTLTLNTDGSFSYVPSTNFNGIDSFTYKVTDSNGGSAEAIVTLTSVTINHLPVANADSYTFNEDTPLIKLISDSDHLLTNDSDADGDALTVNTTPVSNVSSGSLTLNNNGSFSYIPRPNFHGTDSFTYEISDVNGDVAQASVTLVVNSINDVPVAVNDSYSFAEDFTWERRVTDGDQLLSNDSDADGDTLVVNTTPVSNVSNGTLTLNNDGSFLYVPDSDFSGIDNFTYQISDGNGGSAQASVTLIVHAIADLPIAVADSYTVDEDVTLFKLVGDSDHLLSNDSDADGDSLTVNTTPIFNVSNGSLTLVNDGSFTYIPNSEFNGADSFTYQINDGHGGTAQASVSLTIQAVNDAPIATNQVFNIDEDKTDGDIVGTVVASDKEGDSLSYTLTAGDTALFNISSTTGVMTLAGTQPLDFETNSQHNVTVTIADNGIPIAESTDINIVINVNDTGETGVLSETLSFGRPVIGALELTGIKTQAKLTDSVHHGDKVYFVGSVDNVDKDLYMVAYNRDGLLDNSFGNAGVKTFDFGDNEYAKSIVTHGGKYYIAFDRDNGTYTEICFLKVNGSGDLEASYGNDGLSCTTEQRKLSINDAVLDGNNIIAVGKVEGTDDDLLVIKIDDDGNFIDHTPADITDSPHIYKDISGLGLDDEGVAIYSPDNNKFMITGNVLTSDGDKDIFAWLLDDSGTAISTFNSGTAQFYDVSGTDDQVYALGGEEESGFTTHMVGATVLANGVKEAVIIAIDATGAPTPLFGNNGIVTYDVDGDADAGTGYAEFTGFAYYSSQLYLSGTLFDGQSKPFTTRVFANSGAVDIGNYGVGGYQKIAYATDNAYALNMTLDDDYTMWLSGYVESGSDKNMIINAVDVNGALCNKDCEYDFADGKEILIHSSMASDDTLAQVIQITSGLQQNKFIAVSTADDGTNQHVIMTRLTQAGLLDTSFDSDGHKQLKIATSTMASGLFELPNNQLIVYGNVTDGGVVSGFIARIDQNGLLDSSFATGGIYTATGFGASALKFNQVKVDTLGRLVAVGSYENGSKSAFVLRLSDSGVLDSTFNTLETSGYIIGAVTDDYSTVTIDSSNSIYVAGYRDIGDKDMLLVKYLATGALDSSLNGSGELTVDVNSGIDDYVEHINFDSNSDLYLIGNELGVTEKVAIAKVSSAGVLDSSFSNDGIASITMAPLFGDSGMTSAAIGSNNNIVVAGFGEILGAKSYMVGRIKTDGSLDSTFDINGYFMTLTCNSSGQLESIILLNNSSLVVAGQCYVDSTEGKNIEISHYQLN
ncbi:tandem-95 repeat protein [Colwellia sp. Arc7-635]|uniref:tandem-95 repeat protein n=1 Tax=Colwellia sp. Arc7-635 TaxID=2497879 RepID=UPI000F84FDC9|nr:tandem-95 repeat protein [Colwellia sp. Arc7-635]AZQ85138.1 tandem-95 repeat protein [Colwellia sp. Arc7-635]